MKTSRKIVLVALAFAASAFAGCANHVYTSSCWAPHIVGGPEDYDPPIERLYKIPDDEENSDVVESSHIEHGYK